MVSNRTETYGLPTVSIEKREGSHYASVAIQLDFRLFASTHHISVEVSPAPGATRNGTYVVCLDCGKEFAYNWDEMRVGVTLPNKTARLAPVADGTFDGLPRHVS